MRLVEDIRFAAGAVTCSGGHVEAVFISTCTEFLTRPGNPSIHPLLQKAQVRWAGHVTLMPDDRLPKQLIW